MRGQTPIEVLPFLDSSGRQELSRAISNPEEFHVSDPNIEPNCTVCQASKSATNQES